MAKHTKRAPLFAWISAALVIALMFVVSFALSGLIPEMATLDNLLSMASVGTTESAQPAIPEPSVSTETSLTTSPSGQAQEPQDPTSPSASLDTSATANPPSSSASAENTDDVSSGNNAPETPTPDDSVGLPAASDNTPTTPSVQSAPVAPEDFTTGARLVTLASSPLEFSVWTTQTAQAILEPPVGPDVSTLYKLNDSLFEFYSGPIFVGTEGVHSLYFQSYDTAQMETLQVREVKIDRTAPSSVATAIFSRPNLRGFTVAWPASIDLLSGVDHYELTLQKGETLVMQETTPYDTNALFSDIDPGTYALTISAVDLAGNQSESMPFEVMVGIPAPVLSYSFEQTSCAAAVLADAWITQAEPIGIKFSAQSAASTLDLRNTTLAGSLEVTSVATIDGVATATIQLTGDGHRTIVLSAEDPFGNQSELSIEMRVDRTAPSLVGLISARQNETTGAVCVSWSKATDITAGVNRYKVSVRPMSGEFAQSSDYYTTQSWLTIPMLDEGAHEISVTAVDFAGNSGKQSSIRMNAFAVVAPQVVLTTSGYSATQAKNTTSVEAPYVDDTTDGGETDVEPTSTDETKTVVPSTTTDKTPKGGDWKRTAAVVGGFLLALALLIGVARYGSRTKPLADSTAALDTHFASVDTALPVGDTNALNISNEPVVPYQIDTDADSFPDYFTIG